jgi:hypothetical protein
MHSVIKLVGAYVFKVSQAEKDQQWEGSSEDNMKLEATATEL